MKLCLIFTALLSAPVLAANPELSVFSRHQPLTDPELAAMSGKYTVAGQDLYFGLQLQTRFLQKNGVSRDVLMQVEMNITSSPTVTVRIDDNDTSSAAALAFNTLEQRFGLQQRNQVAGDSNRAMNDLDLQPGRLTASGHVITLGQTVVSNTDSNIKYSAAPGALGFQIGLPAGLAEQGLIHGNNKGLLLQGININGANHDVTNRASIRYDGLSLGVIKSHMLQQQLLGITSLGL